MFGMLPPLPPLHPCDSESEVRAHAERKNRQNQFELGVFAVTIVGIVATAIFAASLYVYEMAGAL